MRIKSLAQGENILMLGFEPSTFCIQNRHSNHYTNCSHLVHSYSVRNWAEEDLHATVENVRNSPKVSVFCAISNKQVHCTFFFEGNVIGDVFLHMPQYWLMDEFPEMKTKPLFINSMRLHLTRSSLCGFASMKICEGDG